MSLIATLAALLVAPQTVVTSRIEVPFRQGDDAIIVDATVNGKKMSFMFDTGFSGSLVVDNQINFGPRTGSMRLRDFVGEFEAPLVKVKTLTLGTKKIDTTDMEAVQQPARGFSSSYGTHVDGIMGFEVIKHAITEINFEQRKFIFYPDSMDITKRKPDNQKTFLAKLLPVGGNSLEMEVMTKGGKRMILALDTGNAFYATTHRDVLERVGLWPAGKKPKYMKLAGVASGVVESWSFRMPEVTIYGVPVKESLWDIIDLPASDAEGDGTVGYGFLKNFNIIIDYQRRRVWLENFTGKVSNEAPAGTGISAIKDPSANRTIIVLVAPESAAEKAGLKRGDLILSIDGQDVLNLSQRKIDQLLEGVAGTKVKLAVSRQGTLTRHEIERIALYNEG